MTLELATHDHITSHNLNHVSAGISSNERD